MDDFLRIKDFCKSITSVDYILGTLLVLVYQMKKKYNERSLHISRRVFDEYFKKMKLKTGANAGDHLTKMVANLYFWIGFMVNNYHTRNETLSVYITGFSKRNLRLLKR